jgi:hypothetical protein
MLNYHGIRNDLLEYTVDCNPRKQRPLLPSTRIPVYGPQNILETRLDFALVLPQNLKDGVCSQVSGIRALGGKFVILIPEVAIL